MSIAESGTGVPSKLAETIKKKRSDIIVENERLKSKRNSRRWKEERDPAEYEKQKADQRAEYAAKVAAEEGREVRAYLKVPGTTRAEREANAKQRHAEKQRDRWSKVSQDEKDRKADQMKSARMRKAGVSEDQIAEEMARRAEKRLLRQPDPGNYEDNPDFGAF